MYFEGRAKCRPQGDVEDGHQEKQVAGGLKDAGPLSLTLPVGDSSSRLRSRWPRILEVLQPLGYLELPTMEVPDGYSSSLHVCEVRAARSVQSLPGGSVTQ